MGRTTIGEVSDAPVLHTERLRLRGHRVEDLASVAELWRDPEVVHHIGGQPSSAEEAWGRLLKYAGLWALLGYGYWLVETRDTGRFVGEVGFANFHRDLEPPLGDTPEAGWVLSPWSHGRGYATEAVTAVHQWGDAEWGEVRTACLIGLANAASIRVAIKCGYQETTRTTYHGDSVALYERLPQQTG